MNNSPFPSPVPPKVPTELELFKEHFDKVCMDALDKQQEDQTYEFPELILQYKQISIALPIHAQLYDDFMEFLNQQINNE